MTYSIEVAVAADVSTTERGRLLERFTRTFLETQQYKVVEEIRLTGVEIDLLAEHTSTGEKVLVECKAYRSAISSEVIAKLLGNVMLRNVSAGWLFSTFPLGKEAKGVKEEWNSRDPQVRRQLRISDPDVMIQQLINSRLVVPTVLLHVPAFIKAAEEAYLLLTHLGEFWVIPTLDLSTGIRQRALAFHAATGTPAERDVLRFLASTDTSLAALSWESTEPSATTKNSESLKTDLQSIVTVPVAEHWADYRPSRPADYVGRDVLLDDIFSFMEAVRHRTSRTRLLALKAPSGWGKSSTLIKLCARASNIRNKGKYFAFAVDSRAATSRRFGELALFTAIREAIKSGFIDGPPTFTFGGADDPFATDAMQAVVAELKVKQKVICLFFDQFEELLYKEDLEPVFDELRLLCDAVSQAQENVIIGFSWKTDGHVPADHKAYYLWHSLADHRREFELLPFSKSEMRRAINRLSSEIRQVVSPPVKRMLSEHCQGFPWLLKKLSIHIVELVKLGMDQSEVLTRSMRIQDLFSKDIERLNAAEFACVKKVATDSPAEFFSVVSFFGEAVINSLLDKRLIIRSGLRLSVYWDIFRDYVLTNKIPYIPTSYVPQAAFHFYVQALTFLLNTPSPNYEDLEMHLGITPGTTDNLVRDLLMVGHAEANRKLQTVSATFTTLDEAHDVLIRFLSSHAVFQKVVTEKGGDGLFPEGSFSQAFKASFVSSEFSARVKLQYYQRLMRWFQGAGLLERVGPSFQVSLRPSAIAFLNEPKRRGRGLFLAEASPDAVVELASSKGSYELIGRKSLRNAKASSRSLGIEPCSVNAAEAEMKVREAGRNTTTIQLVLKLLDAEPNLNDDLIGARVGDRFGFSWSPASQRRYGAALRRWALWCNGGELKRRKGAVVA